MAGCGAFCAICPLPLEVDALKLKTDLIIRSIADTSVAIPAGPAAAGVNGLLSLTPSGELLVRMLHEECELPDLVAALVQEYDVSAEQAQEDVERFISKLKEVHLL